MLNNGQHRYFYASAVSLCHCLAFFLSQHFFFFNFLSFLHLYHSFLFNLCTLRLDFTVLPLSSFVPHPTFFTCCSLTTILPSLLPSQQVFWGQEHLNCLKLVEEHLQVYLNLQKDSADSCSKGKARHTQPPPSPGSPSPRTEHSSDDLRTGHFQYIQDSGEVLYSAC